MYSNKYDVRQQNDTNTGKYLIPDSVYTLLPPEAKYNACEFARLTNEDFKYQHIFNYGIHVLEACGENVKPEVVQWVEQLAEINVTKLSKDT